MRRRETMRDFRAMKQENWWYHLLLFVWVFDGLPSINSNGLSYRDLFDHIHEQGLVEFLEIDIQRKLWALGHVWSMMVYGQQAFVYAKSLWLDGFISWAGAPHPISSICQMEPASECISIFQRHVRIKRWKMEGFQNGFIKSLQRKYEPSFVTF